MTTTTRTKLENLHGLATSSVTVRYKHKNRFESTAGNLSYNGREHCYRLEAGIYSLEFRFDEVRHIKGAVITLNS